MKKILYFAVLGVLLSACQKEQGTDTDGNAKQVEARVTIDGLDVVAQSRAMTQMNDAELKTQGFTVAGYRTDGKFAINAPYHAPNLFNADGTSAPVPKVTYNTTANKFMLDIPKSRAAAGSYLSFFAWSQSTPVTSSYGIVGRSADNAKGYPWIDVVNNPAPESQNDVTVAAAVDLDNEYLISLVNLNFKHIFSKLSFKVKSSTGNTFKLNSATIKYGADVYTKGRYTFDGSSSIGAWSNLETPSTMDRTLNGGTTITGTTAVDLGEIILVPQAVVDGFVSLVISYNTPSGDYTKTIPLKALALKQNTNYQYTIDITPTSISIGDPRIVGWYDDLTTRMPVISGPMGDVKLLLDGSEAPYVHTDNTRWWLDHSGYNNHCQIIETDKDKIVHNLSEKAYVITRANGEDVYNIGGYIRVPDLGNTSAATVEIVTSLTNKVTSYQTPYLIAKSFPTGVGVQERQLRFEIKTNESLLFDVNNGGSAYTRMKGATNPYPENYQKEKTFYAQRYVSGKEMSIMRNSLYEGRITSGVPSQTLELKNGLLGLNMIGKIHYFKVVTNSLSDVDVRSDYEALKNKFNIPATGELTPAGIGTVPTFSDNLVCYLNAADAFQTDGVQTYWLDRSGRNNHALVFGSAVTQNTASHIVSTPGTAGNYLKLVKSLGEMPNGASIFLIGYAPGVAFDKEYTLFNFNTVDLTVNSNVSGIYSIMSPESDNGNGGKWANMKLYAPNAYTGYGDGQYISNASYWWTYYASKSNLMIASKAGRYEQYNDGGLPELRHCYFFATPGGQTGNFQMKNCGAILIYNRILTKEETNAVKNAIDADWTK